LEGLAVRAATANIPDAELERAWQTLSESEARYSATGNTQDLLTHDSLVHDLIMQHSDNEMLIALMRGLRDLSIWAQRTAIHLQPKAVAKALPEHKKILAAIRARSPADAEQALLNHLNNTLKRTLPHLKHSTSPADNSKAR
jgi:DNA-binding GntR family transcriptional regulator